MADERDRHPHKARRVIFELLRRRGVFCTTAELAVRTTTTARGERLHVIIAVNGAERALDLLVRSTTGKLAALVGVRGVCILRPEDVDRLAARCAVNAD